MWRHYSLVREQYILKFIAEEPFRLGIERHCSVLREQSGIAKESTSTGTSSSNTFSFTAY